MFKLKSKFKPAGDQPKAIEVLVKGVKKGLEHQTLLGVTGSGKTFTVANVIQEIQRPTLVIAHNKTLAAQLAQEYKDFFPDAAVHYFVSYYDYYQPEAYMPITDTYIEKDAQINEEIDRLRHASTQALLTRKDVIIVASVSCIYGLGSPAEYEKVNKRISVGDKISRNDFMHDLVSMHYERNNADLSSGKFRAVGNSIDIMPMGEQMIYRLSIMANKIERIELIDPITRRIKENPKTFFLFPAKHFVTNEKEREKAVKSIAKELKERLAYLEKNKMLLEAERLRRRTNFDIAMMREVGYCNGIENYSRHLSGKPAGVAPETLLSYFPRKKDGSADFLTVIDESHVTVSQIRGMYAGDRSRKETLVEYGFRLPSALDNRPLRFEEFEKRVGQVLYTSATPGDYEREKGNIVEQIIRPTGLLDPEITIRKVTETKNYKGQVADLINETIATVKKGDRVIATTLTKKMAEDLAEFLKEKGVKAEYLHSEIKTLERIKILTSFRKGVFDCLVGVNLLREGLDLPEVSLIGILDADREGFLRSETSLVQIIGRAARNINGNVILYADNLTKSISRAVSETNRRRKLQMEYNKKHNITPKGIIKSIQDITEAMDSEHDRAVRAQLIIDKPMFDLEPLALISRKEEEMGEAVKILDFETAAILRDEIKALEVQLVKKNKKVAIDKKSL